MYITVIRILNKHTVMCMQLLFYSLDLKQISEMQGKVSCTAYNNYNG